MNLEFDGSESRQRVLNGEDGRRGKVNKRVEVENVAMLSGATSLTVPV